MPTPTLPKPPRNRHAPLRQSLGSGLQNALMKYAETTGVLPETVAVSGVTVRLRDGRRARYSVTVTREFFTHA
ncbi:hypothetical protein [Thiocapsa sp. UBA6158]|uniref:hypothetical protein n=1 Tax=Thiocapsa sp. UBA6158 TaxID=1947692 RepID=UPI0025FFDD86|nr:hypothetical protein [Thiocapsa sp. UBA6158]